ncbi:ABC transporter substrate-binding protein [Gracilibacillus alcaliphilus]|uniref:ABC transporter substrate-binding protein n=1 Tax=Gracilibacillus alcaliphilus TaxID=1401441 RepID=UPI0019572955|nr:sugar ABC transporter substrate-binding protein [Gracilibacillus alcaliphilus]MBM7677866.1 multiple sugar transport system substrate-binding protein [Gracilibacillus alcaliphilus]
MKKLSIFLLLVLAVLIAGCSNSDSSEGSDSDGDGQVTIQMAISGSNAEQAIRKATADAFMEENPDIKIEWVDLGDRRYEKTLTLISGGNAPDILYLNEWVPALASRNALLPLDDLIESDESFSLDLFYDGLINGNIYEDQLYALPQEVSPFVVYYNKELFDQTGVDYPTDDWTQEEFYQIAEQLTDAGKNQYGYLHENGYNPTLGWVFRNGGELFNDQRASGLDSAGTLEALEFINDIVQNKLSPNPAQLEATGQGADAQFRNQQVAMISAGMWLLPPFKEEALPFEWDVVKMPVAANQTVGAGILNWGISNQTEHPEEAWEVLKYFVGHEGMMKVAESNMALPASEDEEANQVILDSGFPENVAAFVDSADSVVMDGYTSPFTSEIDEMFKQEVEKMLLGKEDPQTTQEQLHSKLNEIINQ